MAHIKLGAAGLVLTAFALHPAVAAVPRVDIAELMAAAVRLPCEAKAGTALVSLADALPFAQSKRNGVSFSRAGIVERRMVFSVGADELTVRFRGAIGDPRQVSARYVAGGGERQMVLAEAGGGCMIHTARLLHYDEQGRPERLEILDSALHPTGEVQALNPQVPAGADPTGIPVGLVDTGVNYLLPEIAVRLARDASGRILGYDFWDLDGRPFDVSLAADPFFPDHHGTETASLLLEEAPVAKLIPYRYPRSDMSRMTALVEDAARHGIRVMNLSLASADREEWHAIIEAARAHSEMLFVAAAGNFGHNIELRPAYPASAGLANMVVVTSATVDGHLTLGVNWGPSAVDLMVPGENVVVRDFDGRRRRVSGSSYAAARVSALAACLLAGNPEWTTAELMSAMFAGARPEQRYVAHGFLSDLALRGRGACVKAG